MDPGFKISIIVPCLNEEKMLPFFLSSLEDQHIWTWGVAGSSLGCMHPYYERRRFPFELIVVDGGSTDSSLSLIDSYRSKMPVTGIIDTTRNLGYVRNRGALASRSQLLLFTNSDTILPVNILHRIYREFKKDPNLIALSGRTVPINGGTICTAAYAAFDLLRWIFNKIGGFSPSGNFLAIRASVFFDIGGFHNLIVNEDGELGNRIREYARRIGGKTRFRLNLHVWHHAERFRKNSLKALFFYLYVFGNVNLLLRVMLQPIEQKSSREFSN